MCKVKAPMYGGYHANERHGCREYSCSVRENKPQRLPKMCPAKRIMMKEKAKPLIIGGRSSRRPLENRVNASDAVMKTMHALVHAQSSQMVSRSRSPRLSAPQTLHLLRESLLPKPKVRPRSGTSMLERLWSPPSSRLELGNAVCLDGLFLGIRAVFDGFERGDGRAAGAHRRRRGGNGRGGKRGWVVLVELAGCKQR
jgi:hypothetical protein